MRRTGGSPGSLSIGEVAERTGHTVVRLRHWEKVGLLEPPPREGGKRRYPPSVLSRIAVIDLARKAGFRLPEIREVLIDRNAQRTGDRWRALTGRKAAELDELQSTVEAMRALLAHLAACDCDSLEECARLSGMLGHDTPAAGER
jgi:MerR family transcriptional regulator, redox-sensitive transcriptional activator SoxR